MKQNTLVDITSREFKTDPYPYFAQCRAEAPVCRAMLGKKQPLWLVTRYEDVVQVLKDERFVKNPANVINPDKPVKQPWMPPIFEPLMKNMLDTDEPDHRRLRNLVHQAFTPRRVQELRTRVQSLTHELLDAVAYKGTMDLIRDYALPLPLIIIAEMLGVPTSDRDRFHRWTKAAVKAPTVTNVLLATPYIWRFMRYIRRLTAERRLHPQDDLISALVQAEDEGERLSEDEVIAMIFLLLLAGHETTVNLIASGTLALLQHPDQLALLRQEPALIETAVEELLRYANPVEMATERFTREAVTIADVTIPKGEMVLAVVASANRDERVFENPDQLDIRRAKNRHLAFGQGIHYCLGAPLARLEGTIAINTLLARLPELRLAVPPTKLKWRPVVIVRGLEALPVSF